MTTPVTTAKAIEVGVVDDGRRWNESQKIAAVTTATPAACCQLGRPGSSATTSRNTAIGEMPRETVNTTLSSPRKEAAKKNGYSACSTTEAARIFQAPSVSGATKASAGSTSAAENALI